MAHVCVVVYSHGLPVPNVEAASADREDGTFSDDDAADSTSLDEGEKRMLLEVLPSMDRIVHLDLKGAAPKLSYLREFLPLIKSLGATGLLIGS